ncbi:hypothetical protein BU24DRAFT_228539 [Aaosphaeria arxii CBS 175.79]|uniref:Uncharacterized protein n=1 Tax=Aaosphaeria arxii CBS 175.79 TaxID=1450172 RepID=A0A6A5XQL4_9PLEO|nr:uncharacterized protein BU24DRAFT_228539 [Aaosphaeria arxii CBS 175.79]KAF2015127.1 hypothetical protein BU24DRAFT_228539 [Aaosphaeria arxii CBS 175.79]
MWGCRKNLIHTINDQVEYGWMGVNVQGLIGPCYTTKKGEAPLFSSLLPNLIVSSSFSIGRSAETGNTSCRKVTIRHQSMIPMIGLVDMEPERGDPTICQRSLTTMFAVRNAYLTELRDRRRWNGPQKRHGALLRHSEVSLKKTLRDMALTDSSGLPFS